MLLLEWRNLPEIVALGTLKSTVSKVEHEEWFAAKLRSADAQIWIVQCDGKPVGQVRLDPQAKQEKIISVFLLPNHIGRGFGVDAISQACRMAFALWRDLKSIRADILANNERSRRAFLRAGFAPNVRRQDGEGAFSLFMKRPFVVPHNRLTYGAKEVAAASAVVRTGRWAGGQKVAEFESRLQDWSGTKHAVCVGSGLAALRLSLAALGVERGDNVLLPAYSCVALPNAVLANEANPIAADVESGSWNIGLNVAEMAVRHDARAAIAVNTFGFPLQEDLLRTSPIDIVEDWAHGFRLDATGCAPAELISKVAIQSFYATKLLGVGEGGAVLTNSSEVAEYVRQWRDYSDLMPNARRMNDKMTDISAAIGIAQLERLPLMIRRRAEIAAEYGAMLGAIDALREHLDLPLVGSNRVWYRYPIFLKIWDAKQFIDILAQHGVIADMPVCNWRPPGIAGKSVAMNAYRGLVSLPLYPTLTRREQKHVVKGFINTTNFLIKAYGQS